MVSPSKRCRTKDKFRNDHGNRTSKLKTRSNKAGLYVTGFDGNSCENFRPLEQKKFYLDLKNSRGISSLAENIQLLGGSVEEFLTHDVSHVITDRVDCSPDPGASRPGSVFSARLGDSPVTTESPGDGPDKKRVVKSRGEAMLENARSQKGGTADILANAKKFGVEICPLAKVLKWFEKLRQFNKLAVRNHTSSKVEQTRNCVSSKRLNSPYLKFESITRQYRPIYRELVKWPVVNLQSPTSGSVFAEHQRRSPLAQKSLSSRQEEKEATKQIPKKGVGHISRRKSGYCELCSVSYINLEQHIKCEKHQSFARNEENYVRLDELIGDQGSLASLLDKYTNEKSKTLASPQLCPQDMVTPQKHEGNHSPVRRSPRTAGAEYNQMYIKIGDTVSSKPFTRRDMVYPVKKELPLSEQNGHISESEQELHNDIEHQLTRKLRSSRVASLDNFHFQDFRKSNTNGFVRSPRTRQFSGFSEPDAVQLNGIEDSIMGNSLFKKGEKEGSKNDHPNNGPVFLPVNGFSTRRRHWSAIQNRESALCEVEVSGKEKPETVPKGKVENLKPKRKSKPACLSQDTTSFLHSDVLPCKLRSSGKRLMQEKHDSNQQPCDKSSAVGGPTLPTRGTKRADGSSSDSRTSPKLVRIKKELPSDDTSPDCAFPPKRRKTSASHSVSMVLKEEVTYTTKRLRSSSFLSSRNNLRSLSRVNTDVNHLGVPSSDKVYPSKVNSALRKSPLRSEKLFLKDNKDYYKFEILNEKLRSTRRFKSVDIPKHTSPKQNILNDKKTRTHRLSQVERFIRDNREYYKFELSESRLRKHVSYRDGLSDSLESSQNLTDQEPGKQDGDDGDAGENQSEEGQDNPPHDNQQAPGKSGDGSRDNSEEDRWAFKKTKGRRRRRRGRLRFTLKRFKKRKGFINRNIHSEIGYDDANNLSADRGIYSDLGPSTEDTLDEDTNLPDDEEFESSEAADVQTMLFSFEKLPAEESWYQTYQRQDEGQEIRPFFADMSKPFLLPFEMPLHAVFSKSPDLSNASELKNQASTKDARDVNEEKNKRRLKKVIELSEFPRKSPRCHASTLAILSNLSRQNSGASSPAKTPTDTPTDSSCEDDDVSSVATVSETQEQYEEIEKSIKEMMDSVVLSSSDTENTKKGKGKGKKRKCRKPSGTNFLNSEYDPEVFEAVTLEGTPNFEMDTVDLDIDVSSCFDIYHNRVEDFSRLSILPDRLKQLNNLSSAETSSECASSTTSEVPPVNIGWKKGKKRRPNMTGWPKKRPIKKRALEQRITSDQTTRQLDGDTDTENTDNHNNTVPSVRKRRSLSSSPKSEKQSLRRKKSV